MGLFISQKDQRSELQERIAADLREKAKQSALQEGDGFDDTRDSAYLEGTKQTTTLAPAWLLILVLAAIIVGLFLAQGR